MRREELVARNLRLSAARHAASPRQRARQAALRCVAKFPVPQRQAAGQQRILLIRPDHLGDALLTIPALTTLRAAFPNAELRALASPRAAPVFASLPSLDEVQTMDFPGIGHHPQRQGPAPWLQALQIAAQLRRQACSVALILRPDHWWGALVAWLAGIPQRIGYDLAETAPFLTQALPLRREHALLRNLRLAGALTGQPLNDCVEYRFPPDASAREAAATLLRDKGIRPDMRFICIHPGTGAALKHWAEARWARLADRLGAIPGAQLLFSGSAAERALVQRIRGQMTRPAINIAGETTLAQLAACYERALMVLGPDSGPLHLAAAVGTPTLSLFGPADPVEFRPWGPAQRHVTLASPIACRPCRVLDWPADEAAWHPCLQDISVEQVFRAALTLHAGVTRSAPASSQI